MSHGATGSCQGLLGDTPRRDYSRKLQLFNAFAEPELRRAIASLALTPGMHVLDAGCGTGAMLPWLHEAVQPGGTAIGIDLAFAHTRAARATNPPTIPIVLADLTAPPLKKASLDLVWSVNTLHHLKEPSEGLRALSALVRPGGRIVIGQSSFLPDMLFGWDSRLERLTHEAVGMYYRERYALTEQELSGIRSLVGTLRSAALSNVSARTFVIERISPLAAADEEYLAEAIFRDTWGERLRPYLSADDYERLRRVCDPQQPEFALHRPDFHFIQTFTLAVGQVPGASTSSSMKVARSRA